MLRALGLIAFVGLLSCRSVDTELYARTKRELARFQHGFAKLEAPSSNPLPAAWAKGQFAVWALTADEETTLIAAEVEANTAEGAVITIVSLSPKVRTTARLSFEHQPTDIADARASLRQVVRRRGDSAPFTYVFREGATRPEMLDALQPLWGMLVPAYANGEAKTVATAAATLQGCRPADASFVYKHTTLAVQGWAHPAVPISGFVKGATKNPQETVELMEYGWTGGAPAL